MMMIGFDGLTLSEKKRNLISEISSGGVILFSRNAESPEQIKRLCSELQSICTNTPSMFIAVDQEGGRVRRFKEPFTHFPAMKNIGLKDSIPLASEFGTAAARELKAVGVNVNFAPVLDVDSNPDNPIIGDRSLGNKPEIVSRLSVPIIEAFHNEGVLAVGKHFPGHGDTNEDSHLTMPFVKKDKESLYKCELIPFRNAVENGLKALMTAHVVYPALDSENPATLSKAILTKILREEMKFDGIIFSDDFEMKALEQSTLGEAAVGAVKAGVDVLITCHDEVKQRTIYGALLDAVKSGDISTSRVEESYNRILKVKNTFLTKNKPPLTWVGHEKHKKLASCYL